MKFLHSETYGWKSAFHGLRNPLESWAKSDSEFGISNIYGDENTEVLYAWLEKFSPLIILLTRNKMNQMIIKQNQIKQMNGFGKMVS